MENVAIKVAGMTCQGCVRSITRALEATPGVQRVQISLEQGQADITYEAGRTGPGQLKAAIVDAGYEVD